MSIYISQVKLTNEGLQELKSAPDRVDANRKLWRDAGGKLLEWYIVLGDYDYLLISEAPSEKVMAEIVAKATARGRTRFKTFTAIPIDQFSEVSKRL